jgi:TonB family protein
MSLKKLLFAAIAAISVALGGCGGKMSADAGRVDMGSGRHYDTDFWNTGSDQYYDVDFWDGEVDVSWYNANTNVVSIITAKELAGIAKLVNEGIESFEGKTILLGRDIFINDTANWRDWANNPPAYKWTGIGTYSNRFEGTFDGRGHTISGVYIKNPDDNQGLFGVIGSQGKVTELNVTASYIEGGNYAGIFVGGNAGFIAECRTFGVVVGDSIVGGLAGINEGAIITSYATGSVRGRVNVGGFTGANGGGLAVGNHSSSTVSGDSIAGGFMGVSWSEMMVGGNFSTGKVTGSVDVGGFAGRVYGGYMRNNYYEAKLPSTSSDNGKGGSGIGKTRAEMQTAEFVDSLNAVTGILSVKIWAHSNSGYPALTDKSAYDDGIDGQFASGEGTIDDPYIIDTREQLAIFSMYVNIGVRFLDKHVKLGRDIALNDTANWQNWATEPPAHAWMPAGTNVFMFEGTLDGGGYTVSGVYINDPKGDYSGLFGKVSKNALIKNVGVTASYIRGHRGAGGLAGWNGGRIVNSYSTAVVAVEEILAGGLVGRNNGGTITGSYATGAVSGREFVGGLAGDNIDGGTISNSYATGAVKGGRFVGGFVGTHSEDAAINSCYTIGTVTGNEDADGFVGSNNQDYYIGEINNSFFDIQTSGLKDNCCGHGRTTEQMKQKETFAGWNFDRIWGIDSTINNGYPHLLRKTVSEPKAVRENTEWYSAFENEFAISTADELVAFAEIVNGTARGIAVDNFFGKTVRLTANIDLSEYDNWMPIGMNVIKAATGGWIFRSFAGTFDGGGHIISNLTVNRHDSNYQGLFGRIETAMVKNVGLENVNIVGGDDVGAVVGTAVMNSVITNCYSTGTVGGKNSIGGVAGSVRSNSFVTNCYSTASVSSKGYAGSYERNCAGGVVGDVWYFSMITNSYSTGAVNGIGNIGGIVGNTFGVPSNFRNNVALNPELKGTINVSRVVASIWKDTRDSQFSNNAGYADMKITGSPISSPAALAKLSDAFYKAFRAHTPINAEINKLRDTLEKATLHADPTYGGWLRTHAGAAITAAEIHADPTLGGRFREADGWTTEPGRLPGLFGRTVEMPPHLVINEKLVMTADSSRTHNNLSVNTTLADTSGNEQLQVHGRLRRHLGDLPEGGTLVGGRSRASVQHVIVTEYLAAFRLYSVLRQRAYSGTIAVRFTIDESGKVTSAKLENSTADDSVFENAIVLKVKHIDFGPINKPGDVTEVVYPFTFLSARGITVDMAKRPATLPTTLKECYIILDGQFSEDEKDAITFGGWGHDLERSVRYICGNCGLGGRGRDERDHFGMTDEEIAKTILKGYYDYLNGVGKE